MSICFFRASAPNFVNLSKKCWIYFFGGFHHIFRHLHRHLMQLQFFATGCACKPLPVKDFQDGAMKVMAISYPIALFSMNVFFWIYVKRGRVLRVPSFLRFAPMVRAWFGRGSGFVVFLFFPIFTYFLNFCGSGAVRAQCGFVPFFPNLTFHLISSRFFPAVTNSDRLNFGNPCPVTFCPL